MFYVHFFLFRTSQSIFFPVFCKAVMIQCHFSEATIHKKNWNPHIILFQTLSDCRTRLLFINYVGYKPDNLMDKCLSFFDSSRSFEIANDWMLLYFSHYSVLVLFSAVHNTLSPQCLIARHFERYKTVSLLWFSFVASHFLLKLPLMHRQRLLLTVPSYHIEWGKSVFK